jgi:hypothetical protein
VLTRTDHFWLKRCMELVRQEPTRKHQLDQKLAAGETWEELALFCCEIVQRRSMKLQAWQCPPGAAIGAPAIEGREPHYVAEWSKAHELVERMRGLGLSPFVPDPIGEIRRVEELEPPTAA